MFANVIIRFELVSLLSLDLLGIAFNIEIGSRRESF